MNAQQALNASPLTGIRRTDPIYSETGVWEVQSDSDPTRSYTVSERSRRTWHAAAHHPTAQQAGRHEADTGSYLFCECPQWARSIQKGGCKHVKRVAQGAGLSLHPGTVRISVWGAIAIPPSPSAGTDEDRAAVERLMGWAL